MIEKFNFYDVYGYFLPGAVVLLLFWVPVGLVKHQWPAGDWTSAVIALVLAYISGLLLQMFAGKVIPSSVGRGADDHERYPSDRLLDPYSKDKPWRQLSDATKESLAEAIENKFGICRSKIDIKSTSPTKEIDTTRRDAFFQARHYLILNKDATYAEQFEGMYSLTRGLASAFGIAAAYYAGWALSACSCWPVFGALLVAAIGLLLAINTSALLLAESSHEAELFCAMGLLLVAASAGYGLAIRNQATEQLSLTLAFCAGAALLASLRSYRLYREFIDDFAITVWRDFLAASKKDSQVTKECGCNERATLAG